MLAPVLTPSVLLLLVWPPSLSLATTREISFWFLFLSLLRCFSSGGSPHTPMYSVYDIRFFTVCVSTFRNLRVDRLFAANRSLSQLVTSFFGSWCQGILLVLLFAWTSFASVRLSTYIGRFVLSSRIAESLLTVFGFFTSRHLSQLLVLWFSKIVFLPLISNFTWKDQIDFNLCLLPCSLRILTYTQITFLFLVFSLICFLLYSVFNEHFLNLIIH